MANRGEPNLAPVLIFAIIVIVNVVTSIWQSAKKSRQKKLQQEKKRPTRGMGQLQPGPRPQRPVQTGRQVQPQPVTQPQAAGKEAPRSLQEALMRELQRALNQGEKQQAPQEAQIEPKPVAVAPPPPPRSTQRPEPKSPQVVQANTPRRNQSLFQTNAEGRRVTASGVTISEAGIVERRRLDHLALIRSHEDMCKAMLMHEILSQPRSRRPVGANRAS